MAFDELTSARTRRLLLMLLEEMDPEKYSSFFAYGGFGGWSLILVGVGATPQKNPEIDFEETDLQELQDAGYLRLEFKGAHEYKGRLLKRAWDEYRTSKQEALARMPGASAGRESVMADVMRGPDITALHPKIAQRCRNVFEAGEYDSAILNAFKVVEEEVRAKAQAEPTDVGVNLITKVMAPGSPRIVLSRVNPEQEAAHALFRGAIGFIKNPHSHRFVDVTDPGVTLEILAFASFLVRLIDVADVDLAPRVDSKATKPEIKSAPSAPRAWEGVLVDDGGKRMLFDWGERLFGVPEEGPMSIPDELRDRIQEALWQRDDVSPQNVRGGTAVDFLYLTNEKRAWRRKLQVFGGNYMAVHSPARRPRPPKCPKCERRESFGAINCPSCGVPLRADN